MNPTTPPGANPRKPNASAWRRRLPLLGVLLLGALIVVGLWPRAIPVESAVVARGPLVVTVDEEGMTRVRNRYTISAPVAGQLRRIDWKAGAVVEAGKTVLATLETTGADFLDTRSLAQAEARVRAVEASREAAVAQRERASAALKMYAAEFERARQLRARNVLSPQEFEVAQMRNDTAAQDARASEFAFKVAEFELQQARAILHRGQGTAANAEPLVITAPVGGKILRVFQESTRVVPAGFALLEIGDPTDLEVRIEVLSRDAVAVPPGARVMLEQWGGPEPLQARVRWVEPSGFTKISALGVEEQRVYVLADFTDPLGRRATLGDSYRVEARIVTWEKTDTLRVSAGALFQRAGKWQTYLVEGGRARLRAVEAGRSNGVETEVISGLAAGDRVIVYPGDKVDDGTRVSALQIDRR